MAEPITAATMQSRLTELRGQMADIDDELLKLTEKPTLTDSEEERYSDLWAERAVIEPELTKLEERAARAEQIKATKTRELGGVPNFQRDTSELFEQSVMRMDHRAARDGALRILSDREAAAHLSAPAKDYLDKILRTGNLNAYGARMILATENDDYRSAFQKLMTDPSAVAYLTERERYAVARANEVRQSYEERSQTTTSTAGGFAIPVFIDPSFILTNQETDNPYLRLCRVEDITSNIWKGVSGAGVSWSFDAENAEVSDDTLTLAQPSVTAYTARGFIPFSIEIGQDWPGFASEMSRLLLAGYDELLLSKFSEGNGTSEPDGIQTKLLSTAALIVAQVTKAQTGGSYGAVDVYKLWKGLSQKYRRNAAFLSTVDINNRSRQFGNGNSLADFTVDLTAPWSGTFLGKAWYEDPYLDDFNSNTNSAANLIICGDFSNYVIARRAGMTVELVPHILGSNGRPIGQRGWFAYARIGGDVVNTSAFRMLCNNTGA